MQNLRVTLIQSNILWEQIEENLNHFSRKIKTVQGQTDLIVLPEMFSTGFSMKPERVAEPMDGKTMNWLKDQARNADAVVTGSFIAIEDGQYYNRLVWMQPDGDYLTYDKKHLFTLEKEDEAYTAGTKRLIVEWKGWKICPLICYDLRFPAWSRNSEGYDLLIYMASWPTPRIDAWQTLLAARAIENQTYTIGVNRVGEDENGYNYSGASSVFDFMGKSRYRVFDQEDVFTAELNYEEQQAFRKKLNFLADQDRFVFND
jgi:omega-amidase